MNPIIFFGLVGGGFWYMDKRRKDKAITDAEADPTPGWTLPGPHDPPLPGVIDCSPRSTLAGVVPPLAPELGETVNLCGATEISAVVLKSSAPLSPVPAPASSFTRDGDLFTFLESGMYLVGNEQLAEGWTILTADQIPCVDGGTPADPAKMIAMPGYALKLCGLNQTDFTVLPADGATKDDWTIEGERFTPLVAGRYVVTRTMGGGPVWDMIVKTAVQTP